MLAFVFAAWAVIEPEGWVRTTPPALASPNIEQRMFHAPGDPSSVFYASHAPLGSAGLLDEVAARLVAGGAKLGTRSEQVDRGRRTTRLSLELPNGIPLHAREVSSSVETVLGECTGRDALLEACDRKLAELDIAPDDTPAQDHRMRALAIGLAAAAVAAILVALGVRRLLRRRDLARSGPLVDGELVTIAGVVRAAGPLVEAPLSGRSCVYHRSHARITATIASLQVVGEPAEHAASPFVVETRRGAIRIDEPDLELALAPTAVPGRETAAQRAFLARHATAAGAHASFDEVVIAPGATVTLRGVVRLEHDVAHAGERGYRDDAPLVARLERVVVVRIY